MARLCVGRRFIFHVNCWCVLAILFGLTLSSQFEIREISDLVEDFKDHTEKYFFENHNIARRAAPNVSTPPAIPPSTIPPSAIPPSAIPPSTIPPLTIPPSTIPPSAIPPSTIPPSTIPPSAIPPSAIPPSQTTSFVTARIPSTLPGSKKQPTTSKKPPTTSKKPPTTSKKPPTTSKKPPTTTPKLIGTTSKGTTPDDRQTTLTPSEKPDYIEDSHKYYKSQYYSNGKQWWFDLDNDRTAKPKLHNELSKNIQFSHLLQTSFIFPYYGHLVNNVTITNKGYVFLGERLHRFNASAQYAAPLMADFVAGPHTSIRYLDTGDRLTVEWANMTLSGESNIGLQFTFQCTIMKNGTLIFSYKNVPKAVNKLKANNFFVRVGLSDTYKRERIVYGRHTINGKSYSAVRYIIYYLYDRIELNKERVVGGAAFIINPVPNCVMFNSCDTCLNTQTKFDCKWCSKIQRCSDGVDRHRAEWVRAGCVDSSVKLCFPESSNSLNGGVIAVIVILLVVILFAFAWFVYAYSHPQTKSGLCLIRYGNPTKWCRNSSGEGQATSTDGRISFKTMSFESNA